MAKTRTKAAVSCCTTPVISPDVNLFGVWGNYTTPSTPSFLLLESGDYLLLESGDKIIIF